MQIYMIILNFCMTDLIQAQLIPPYSYNSFTLNLGRERRNTITLGVCDIAIDSNCPNPDITFFYYNRRNQHDGEQILIGKGLDDSNLLATNFNPALPTKILIHGYNSDMSLGVFEEIKTQYFLRKDLNLFLVDWSPLAKGPCYPAAVWNSMFVGKCTAQLVDRVRETGNQDIHLIGFSLGAHAAGFTANNVRGEKIGRITGLDPAMPGFATVGNENKLDASDADFVDVIHTNAFIQGAVAQSGHVDFYVNGGVIQPGCWAEARFFACNHHRAPLYFAESINTRVGFWGWPCPSYLEYFLGRCLPSEPQALMGEHINEAMQGTHLVITNSVSPFAVGVYTGPLIDIYRSKYDDLLSENVLS